MSAKTAAERSKEWRAKQAATKASVDDARDELVGILRDQIADLKEQRDLAERRLKEVTAAFENVANALRTIPERIANVERTMTERLASELASIAAGLGGLGGSRSGSLSPSSTPEKERDAREFQDLNGTQRAQGKLSNGTVVPGRLGDEEMANETFATNPNAFANVERTAAAVLDSPKTETRAKTAPVLRPLLGELTEEEVERRRADQLRRARELELGRVGPLEVEK